MKISKNKTENRSRRIYVGVVPVGGGAPVAVQSMTNTPTEDIRATVSQIKRLEKAGCEIVRVAVPHRSALSALPFIKEKIGIPLIADVHFITEIAVGALEAGADCVRVNPGNIGGIREFKTVARTARRLGRAVRIGVNAGSLEPSIDRKKNLDDGEKLVESALKFIGAAETCGLKDVKVSLKSFDVPTTIRAYGLFSSQSDAPLHIGITEAGDRFSGAIRSAVGLGVLLAEGIGDTMRVSLTASPELEVEAAWEILGALNLRRRGVEIVSCPTCGRCVADVEKISAQIKKRTKHMTTPVRIAVMGCEVNGPGEAAAADLGVALNGTGGGILFLNGKSIKRIAPGNISVEILKLLEDPDMKK